MLKNFFRKLLPQPKDINKHAYLRVFGKFLLHPYLWTPTIRSVSLGVAVALFCGFIPFPTQAIFSIFVALLVRANVPVTAIVVWYSNPFTMPAMFYFAYKIGAAILGLPPHQISIHLSLHSLGHDLALIWKPLLLGSFLCGASLAIIGYVLVWGAYAIMREYRIYRAVRHNHKIKNFILPKSK